MTAKILDITKPRPVKKRPLQNGNMLDIGAIIEVNLRRQALDDMTGKQAFQELLMIIDRPRYDRLVREEVIPGQSAYEKYKK